MLRKTISVIIMFFAMICVLSAGNVKNSSFFLELNKPGESYISFIDLSSDNFGGETSSISLSADSAFSTAECSVGIIWNIYTENEGGIYENGSAELALVFQASDSDSGYMLRRIDPTSSAQVLDQPGLNYSVAIRDFVSSSAADQPEALVIEESNTSIETESRTIKMIDMQGTLNPYSGEQGSAILDFSLTPPADGYITGTYTGEVIMTLTIN